ncbi:MAG: hypothetical protein U0350_50775 [Caldilineaceae bacterium]
MILLFTLLALALRLWALDAKGLAYDEAATALMARATSLEIIQFHWNASFEHPPFWQLLMHFWSNLAGQSEFALRFLPALAGTVMIPLVWQLGQGTEVRSQSSVLCSLFSDLCPLSSLIAAGLVLFSPVLVLYSQEARMYTLVGALALSSLLAGWRLLTRPNMGGLLVFALLNWAMLGFHYYSMLLLGGECLALGWFVLRTQPSNSRLWGWLFSAMFLAVLPLLFWMAFAPGFRITAQIVLQGAGGQQPTPQAFLDGLWRDLTFGAIRWQPPQAVYGYWLLPLLVLGILRLLFPQRSAPAKLQNPKPKTQNSPWLWLPVFVGFTPILVSTLLFRTLATRYILFVTPLLYTLIALGIAWLGRWQRWLGFAALAVPLVVAGMGLTYYFGPYEKSQYRQMATFLQEHIISPATQAATNGEAVLLEAPRQHLLAKYYLPTDWQFYTAPAVVLPAYWPISAPPVVPETLDGQLQSALRKQQALWLVLTAEDEVDQGEFVSKYLTAVAYKIDCHAWLDVTLCYFASPHFVHPDLKDKLALRFNQELTLKAAQVSVTSGGINAGKTLLVQLDWRADVKPSLDYRVTLRLLDATGNVISQRDDYPIGPLLPPSTWNAKDEKPGYMALPLPTQPAAGAYRMVVGLYDPATTAMIPYTRKGAKPASEPFVLAVVDIGDTITVRKP